MQKTQHKHTLQHHRSNTKPKGAKKGNFEKVYWPYLPLVLLVAASLMLSGVRTSVAQIGSGNSVLSFATSMSISGLLSATNSERANNGGSALVLNSKLNASAQAKANDMASKNYWSHNTPDGNPPWIFIDAQGYLYQKIGENLAAGFSSENATIQGWMNSPTHKSNMLDTAFSEVGFGFANNPNYTSAGGGEMTIVVAHYGKPQQASTPAPSPASPQQSTSTAPSQTSSPATSVTTQTTTQPAPASTPASDTKTPVKEDTATPSSTPAQATPDTKKQPVSESSSSVKTTKGQLIFGGTAQTVTTISFAIIILAAGLWISRHALIARRYFIAGESFVVHHPLLDIAFITIIAIAYTMTRTAGIIK